MASAVQQKTVFPVTTACGALPRWVLALLFPAALILLPACESQGPAVTKEDRGAYLVGLLGCGRCHTDGALLGSPSGVPLAGSTIGIAVSAYVEGEPPAVVFPGNLTPDVETGIGDWSEDALLEALRHGRSIDWTPLSPVMPWRAYANLETEDLQAIARFLLSQKPVRNRVPQATAPGVGTSSPYVRIGIYLYDGADQPESVYSPSEAG
ncbi:MAG: cytochrome c [Pseudomonadota bacterium]